jgi:folate-dependent phosphoribosylglycinamide formyltransferase PurN
MSVKTNIYRISLPYLSPDSPKARFIIGRKVIPVKYPSMTEIVLLTRDSLRHDYFRMAFGLAADIEVLRTYCETSGSQLIQDARERGESIRVDHLERRRRSEHDYFAPLLNLAPDRSNPTEIPSGSINDDAKHREIRDLDPDLLVAYGCSIIEDPLLSEYEGRFLNLHLGLSPYYRGTGTNFWPLVNGEPEYVGATFMHIDAGVDTGEIVHQLRARVHPDDGPHDIGNRLIADAGQLYPELVRRFDELESLDQPDADGGSYYASSDYSVEATETLYENFENGVIDDYLRSCEKRVSEVPILKNPAIDEQALLAVPEV